jgi:hypothetical protein
MHSERIKCSKCNVRSAHSAHNVHGERSKHSGHSEHSEQSMGTETKWDDGTRVVAWTDAEGRFHKDDGPAVLEYNAHGVAIREMYYCHGDLHRDDGPAHIARSIEGLVIKKTYYDHGKKNRADGPARSERLLVTGTQWHWYYRDDEVHRAGGPALLSSRSADDDVYFRRGRRVDTAVATLAWLPCRHADASPLCKETLYAFVMGLRRRQRKEADDPVARIDPAVIDEILEGLVECDWW